MSIDFMMWRDEYEILRRKYDGARGQMEQGAEKLRQMTRITDQFSVQARMEFPKRKRRNVMQVKFNL
ncbi:glial fibrillary acidic protein-like [Cucumis melo var. makuwa]|uniref:Glial fibrillary acidic protein-like n=3 Tax=Cucumis melo TaxID=3656 RepID=A0A5D3BF90_CUCMM|nr:glial fibrillary acidic protein-like [Cucumis melo var. makuwa]TYJ97734.1 glial fibrillary acidic protein-like [Cucumis melo var. makuwa]